MTSTDASHALPRELLQALRYAAVGPQRTAVGAAPRGFSFVRDFDSGAAFADLPFDPALPSARYVGGARDEMDVLLDRVAAAIGERVPEALAFVDAQLQRVLIRRSPASDAAASSSNRDHVGACVLANLHLPDDRVLLCAEALVHEAVHQHLYRIERRDGNFCDLSTHRRYRSPWSGNWIPLHSFVHACFVYFALLGFWTRFARAGTEPADADVSDRIAQSLFGYAYIGAMLDQPSFPRDSVQPAIVDAIRRIAAATRAADLRPAEQGNLRDALRCDDGVWLDRLATGLQRVSDPVP